jgi:peroxiredoxin
MPTENSFSTLKETIDQFKQGMASQAPKEVLETLGKELRQLAESGIVNNALKVGKSAPAFTLPNPQGKMIRLTDLLQTGPVAVTFYRGAWCPFCNLQLRAFQQILPEIQKLGASFVAISPQTPDHSLTQVEKAELTFPVLSDQGNQVARQYGLVFKLSDGLQKLQKMFGNEPPKFNGDDSWELPMPGTFVIDQKGMVQFAAVDPDWTTRVEPSVILEHLKALSR